MANPFQNMNFNSQNNNYSAPPMFLQPQGNVYVINNTLEVANVPMGSGLSAAICPNEGLLYLKMYQNGAPAMMAYRLIPYEGQRTVGQDNELDEWKQKILDIEKKVEELKGNKGGGKFDELL